MPRQPTTIISTMGRGMTMRKALTMLVTMATVVPAWTATAMTSISAPSA